MTKLKEIVSIIEQFAPLRYQESYDNSGLLIGENDMEITSALLCLDIDESVIDEAINIGSNLIISHHPLVFSGLKRFTKNSYISRVLHKAIKNDIAIYSCHTNIDSVKNGVSYKIGERLGLKNMRPLSPLEDSLCKLVVFCPVQSVDIIREKMCEEGGVIGDYENCSYVSYGEGSFMGNENTDPFIGTPMQVETTNEARVEVIINKSLVEKSLAEVRKVHPYQEVGYDIYPLKNIDYNVGLGIYGDLEQSVDAEQYIADVADILECKVIRYSDIIKREVKRVAICGGSGASFVGKAISTGADIYISADFKYHDFFLESNQITIADIGHFEGEKYTLDIFYDIISKKMPNFAIHYTKKGKNPINYFIAK